MDLDFLGFASEIPKENLIHFDDHYSWPYLPLNMITPQIVMDQAHSTSDKRVTDNASGMTKVAEQVRKFGLRNLNLETLRLSDELFANLIAYGDPKRRPEGATLPQDRSTLGITANRETEASRQAVVNAASAFFNYSQALMRDPTGDMVGRKTGVAGVIVPYIRTLSSFAILERYQVNREVVHCVDGVQRELVTEPRWRDNVRDDHTHPESAIKVHKPEDAGWCDAILQVFGGMHGDRANGVLHVKPYWAYTDLAMTELIENGSACYDANGSIEWGDIGTGSANALGQLWGSMVNMNCNYAIWTNGSKVFFAVRQGRKLTCTKLMNWASRETCRAIIGMTFAAIDEARWKGVVEGNEPIEIAQSLIGNSYPPRAVG